MSWQLEETHTMSWHKKVRVISPCRGLEHLSSEEGTFQTFCIFIYMYTMIQGLAYYRWGLNIQCCVFVLMTAKLVLEHHRSTLESQLEEKNNLRKLLEIEPRPYHFSCRQPLTLLYVVIQRSSMSLVPSLLKYDLLSM